MNGKRRTYRHVVRSRGHRPAALIAALALLLSGALTTTAAAAADEATESRTTTGSEPVVSEPVVSAPPDEEVALPAGTEAGSAAVDEPEAEPSPDADPEQGSDPEVGDLAGPSAGEASHEPRDATATPTPVAPLSVPIDSVTTAVINVSIGGIRTAANDVSDLSGVTLRLRADSNNSPGAEIGEAWATCVSDSDGDCSFIVPDTEPETSHQGECIRSFFGFCIEYEKIIDQAQGVNYGARFWVEQVGAPSGWYLNSPLVTSSGGSDYTFRTPSVVADRTYASGIDFMTDSTTGTWQVSNANPTLPLTCNAGLSVALILDLSGSVADAGAVDDLQNAAKSMVDALAGTGSSMALYTFAETAPRNSGATGRNYASRPINAQGTAIKNDIDAYTASGGTNWDKGIFQVAQAGAGYDLAIMITDGQPTFSHSGGNGSSTRFAEIEDAVFSANALKDQGTRVLAVGVGDGTSGSAANLRAVSGQNAYASSTPAAQADYFQSGWGELAGLLEEVARGATCQASIEIDKQVMAYGATQPTNGGAGWTMAAAVESGSGTLDGAGTKTTDASGSVGWTVAFDSPTPEADSALSLSELISEEQAGAGWSQQTFACTINGAAAADPTALSITSGDLVACTVLNVQHLVPGIAIEKQAWHAPTAAGLDGADEITAGSALPAGTTITWTYTVTNTGETTLHDIVVSDDRAGSAACPATVLAPGHSMVCSASGAVTALP